MRSTVVGIALVFTFACGRVRRGVLRRRRAEPGPRGAGGRRRGQGSRARREPTVSRPRARGRRRARPDPRPAPRIRSRVAPDELRRHARQPVRRRAAKPSAGARSPTSRIAPTPPALSPAGSDSRSASRGRLRRPPFGAAVRARRFGGRAASSSAALRGAARWSSSSASRDSAPASARERRRRSRSRGRAAARASARARSAAGPSKCAPSTAASHRARLRRPPGSSQRATPRPEPCIAARVTDKLDHILSCSNVPFSRDYRYGTYAPNGIPDWELPDRSAPESGRHGCGLRGHPAVAAPARRAEGDRARAVAQRPLPGALPARGPQPGGARSPERRHRARLRRGRRAPVHLDAARPRPEPEGADRPRRARPQPRACGSCARSPTRSTPRTTRG